MFTHYKDYCPSRFDINCVFLQEFAKTIMAQPVRSISLPSRLNPISQKIESELNKLRTSSPLGSESLLISLSGLAELFSSIQDVVQSQLTRQALNHQQCKTLVEETLEGSVWLLDSCGNARDLLFTMKQQVQDLQSALRRSSSSIDSSVHDYICFRKKAKKNIAKSLRELKKMESEFGCFFLMLDVDYNVSIVIKLLRELSIVTISMFQSLFVYVSMPVINRWSLVSKLKAATAAPEKEQKIYNEVGNVDVALCSLHKSDTKADVKMVHLRLETLDCTITRLEAGLERVFRCLLQHRVSLLNLLTPCNS